MLDIILLDILKIGVTVFAIVYMIAFTVLFYKVIKQ